MRCRARFSTSCRSILQGLLASFLVAVGWASSSANAFLYFPVIGPGGERAIVAEQIVPTFTPLGLDYQFFVLNIGPVPITGFSVFIGGAALAPGFTTGGPAFGAAFGPVGNASVPFLTAESNAMAWQFDEFDDRVAPGGPLTSYLVHWHRDAGLLTDPLFVGFFTRFDLFSTLGPVPGGGAVDPPADAGVFRLEFGPVIVEGFLEDPNDELRCGDTNQPACQPLSFAEFPDALLQSAPEPATLSLFAVGLLLAWRARHLGPRRPNSSNGARQS